MEEQDKKRRERYWYTDHTQNLMAIDPPLVLYGALEAFEEERLPREEAWKRRVWWTLRLLGLNSMAKKLIAFVGGHGADEVPVVAALH